MTASSPKPTREFSTALFARSYERKEPRPHKKQTRSKSIDQHIGHLSVPAGGEELVKFIGCSVESGGENCSGKGMAREKGKPLLLMKSPLNEEAEYAVVEEMNQFRPSPEAHVREIFCRDGRADKDADHPQDDRHCILLEGSGQCQVVARILIRRTSAAFRIYGTDIQETTIIR